MLRWIVPLAVLAVPVVASAAAPLPSSSWWEKVTVKMTGEGDAQNCQYQTSLPTSAAPDCKVVSSGLSPKKASAKDVTTITFERRFHPGTARPDEAVMQAGDKLLGSEVMALVIDSAGKVSGCRVVDTSGETGLAYGCDEASNEKFSANGANAGFMTILVYGHNEHMV